MNKYTIDKNDNIESVIQKILYNNHRTILVLDSKKVVGTISEGDILKSIIYKKKFNAKLVSIMNKNFIYLEYKNYTKKDIHKIFAKHLCGLIPIIDKKMNLKEVISLEDYLKNIKQI
jgi:predicted transcriptional regulator